MNKKIVILGAGNIGSAAALLLAQQQYQVTVVDKQPTPFTPHLQAQGLTIIFGDISDPQFLQQAFHQQEYVLSACPYYLNKTIIEAAISAQIHYFDLTEDVATVDFIRTQANTAKTCLMPQCGLAPGYISIAANHLAKQFEKIDSLQLRVGALTQFPNNRLQYNLSWSTDGLINEYSNPCEAIINGQLTHVLPLEGVEHFVLDGIEYEAFNTSGGIGSLAHVLQGQIQNLDYKTIRYKGHRDLMKFLFDDLQFSKNKQQLVTLFNQSIATTTEDVILIYINAKGIINKRLTQKTIVKKIVNQVVGQHHFTGIQLTTAGSACAVIDMHAHGQLPQKGFVMQEQVDYNLYTQNVFTQFYKTI